MKIARHSKILELIEQYDIETQEELALRLNEAGFQVTQATVSRDIRELKLMKAAGKGGVVRYTDMRAKEENLPNREKYRRVLKEAFVSMESAQNIVVIKTSSGMANAAAAALDSMEWKEIVGSLAGDDTIACFTKSAKEARSLIEKIRKMIQIND